MFMFINRSLFLLQKNKKSGHVNGQKVALERVFTSTYLVRFFEDDPTKQAMHLTQTKTGHFLADNSFFVSRKKRKLLFSTDLVVSTHLDPVFLIEPGTLYPGSRSRVTH